MKHRRGFRPYRSPFVKFLAEEVGLKGQENLRSFDLAQIEPLCSHFFGRCDYGIGIRAHEFAKVLGCADDLFEYIFLLWLER